MSFSKICNAEMTQWERSCFTTFYSSDKWVYFYKNPNIPSKDWYCPQQTMDWIPVIYRCVEAWLTLEITISIFTNNLITRFWNVIYVYCILCKICNQLNLHNLENLNLKPTKNITTYSIMYLHSNGKRLCAIWNLMRSIDTKIFSVIKTDNEMKQFQDSIPIDHSNVYDRAPRALKVINSMPN